jgi:hypothetical protein
VPGTLDKKIKRWKLERLLPGFSSNGHKIGQEMARTELIKQEFNQTITLFNTWKSYALMITNISNINGHNIACYLITDEMTKKLRIFMVFFG